MGTESLAHQLARMSLGIVLGIGPLLASTAHAARQATEYAATVENFEGFAEGVASGMLEPRMLRRVRTVKGDNGRVTVKTFQNRGVELQAWVGDNGRLNYASLTISRPGFLLPIGLWIGASRGQLESYLGPPHESNGAAAVYRRTNPVNEGCSDPMTLRYKDDKLVEVSWQWESCFD